MPRWVEHESEGEAGSASDEDAAEEQQLASPQHTAKRKAATLEAGPSSNKKVKLSISLSRAKMECHVNVLLLVPGPDTLPRLDTGRYKL